MFQTYLPPPPDISKKAAINLGLQQKDLDGHNWEGQTGVFTIAYLKSHPEGERLEAMEEIRGKSLVEIIEHLTERQRRFPSTHHSIN